MNIDWNLIIASFSAIAASAASIATFLGWKENRELRKAQTDPFIEIKLETVDQHIKLLRLKITNTGKGGAFNTQVTLKPHSSLNQADHTITEKIIGVFNDARFMNYGINYLASYDSRNTQYLNFYRGYSDGVDIEDFFKAVINARVEFYDLNGKKFVREYEIDASEMQGIYKLGKTFEEAVPKSLEGIQKSVENISKNINRQTSFLDKKSKSEETHWNEYELKQKLNYIKHVKRRKKELDIDHDEYILKKIERRLSIHELRKQNK